MIWIETALTLVAGVVVLMVAVAIILARRPGHVHELGCLSNRWIAEHRVDSPSTSLR